MPRTPTVREQILFFPFERYFNIVVSHKMQNGFRKKKDRERNPGKAPQFILFRSKNLNSNIISKWAEMHDVVP